MASDAGDSIPESELAYLNKNIVLSTDFGGELVIHNKPPWKEIFLALALLTLGVVGIVGGSLMVSKKGGDDEARG